MNHSLPNHPPPIVGAHPFTGVPVYVVSTQTEDSVEIEEEVSSEEVPALLGTFLGEELPEGLPEFSGTGNPFTGLGVEFSIPQRKEPQPAVEEFVAYDDRGLPNVPPPVQKNRGIHTKIPTLNADQEVLRPIEEEEQEEEEIVAEVVVDLSRFREVFFAYFPQERPSWRHVGSVSEYPLVRTDGRAADLAELWPSLRTLGFHEVRQPNGMLSGLVGPEYSIHCGIGRGIVSVQIPLHNDLHSLHEVRIDALEQVSTIAKSRKLQLLGYGIHPVAEPSPDQLNHIFYIFSLFKSIGEEWGLYGVRAQEYVRLSCGQDEFFDQIRLGHVLESVYIALFGNSVVWGGEDRYRYAAAQFLHDQFPLEAGRCGMFLEPPKTLDEYLQTLTKRKNLLLRDEEGWKNSCTDIFSSLLSEREWEPLLFDHMACDWGPVRPILEDGLLEWRCAQQPQDAQLSLAALSLGIMDRLDDWKDFLESFCAEPPEPMMFGIRMDELHKIRMERVREPWNDFVQWRQKAIDYGLGKGEVFTGLIEGVLQLAQDGLEARGLGEEKFLFPLWQRWEKKKNPSQELRGIFARGGMDALLEHCRIKGG
jgi:hypothetical protein